ncbi:MAG TPA: hypothetical protein VN048_04795 [Verrucomicrobiae bacterium]|jgi:hypothetical protein|nr:hypothetical protein [Verrucomicrobiae bacterium]
MNHILRKTMLAVAGAVMAAQTASAGNSYTANSDTLLEFKAPGAANDVIFDLGSVSQFYSGSTTIDLSTIGYNSSFLANVSSSLSSLEWTIVASPTAGVPKGVVLTDEGGEGNISPFFNNTQAAGAAASVNNTGSAYAAILGTGILSPQAVKMPTTTANGYTQNGDDLNGSINGDASVINSDFTGLASAEFEEFDGTGNPQDLGTFTFNQATGQMIFTAVPESATYGVLAGAGLLALSLGRQFGRRKLA